MKLRFTLTIETALDEIHLRHREPVAIAFELRQPEHELQELRHIVNECRPDDHFHCSRRSAAARRNTFTSGSLGSSPGKRESWNSGCHWTPMRKS